jgi:hypothetical protein
MNLLLRAFAASVLILAAAPARAQLDDTAKAKILADPGYKAYEMKRKEIVRSGLKGDAKLKALAALQETNRTVIQKAFQSAGAAGLVFGRPQIHASDITAPGFTLDGDTRVYGPPFSHHVSTGAGNDAYEGGWVAASVDTDGVQLSDVTFRSYAGISVRVPPNALGMVVSADIEVGHIQIYTNCGLNSATGRVGVMLEAQGTLRTDGFNDQQLFEQFGGVGSHGNWGIYPYSGIRHVTSAVVPVTPGDWASAAAGFWAWGHSSYESDVFAAGTGTVRKIYVRFLFPPPPTPTPIAIVAATAAPKVSASAAQSFLAGPPDLVLSALPAGDGWPTELVEKNVGGKTSESTLVRAKVVLKNGDGDDVAKSCSPRFVDFDEAVPALAPGASATVGLLTKIGPAALAAWSASNKPAPARAAAAPGPTPTRAPVAHVVDCRYTLTASLGTNQNRDDPHVDNNSLTRTIHETVSAK